MILCFQHLTNELKHDIILYFLSFVFFVRCQHVHVPFIPKFLREKKIALFLTESQINVNHLLHSFCTQFRTAGDTSRCVKSTSFLCLCFNSSKTISENKPDLLKLLTVFHRVVFVEAMAFPEKVFFSRIHAYSTYIVYSLLRLHVKIQFTVVHILLLLGKYICTTRVSVF